MAIGSIEQLMGYGSKEPQDIYGEKTSSDGYYVVTDRKKVSYTVGAGRDGTQKRNKTINVYSWQPKQQEAAPAAETAAETAEPDASTQPQTPVNNYQPQIDDLNDRINNTQSKENTVDFAGILESMQTSFDQRLAVQANAQAKFLNDLQIQQNTRLDRMAAEQKAAAGC